MAITVGSKYERWLATTMDRAVGRDVLGAADLDVGVRHELGAGERHREPLQLEPEHGQLRHAGRHVEVEGRPTAGGGP